MSRWVDAYAIPGSCENCQAWAPVIRVRMFPNVVTRLTRHDATAAEFGRVAKIHIEAGDKTRAEVAARMAAHYAILDRTIPELQTHEVALCRECLEYDGVSSRGVGSPS